VDSWPAASTQPGILVRVGLSAGTEAAASSSAAAAVAVVVVGG